MSDLSDILDNWRRGREWYIAYQKAREQAANPQPPGSSAPQPRGLLGIPEPPTAMESLGRGAMDVWEPIKQGWYNMTDPAQAQAYRQQRAENERLYQTGFLGEPPPPGAPMPPDMWRAQGRAAVLAPLFIPGIAASGILSSPAAALAPESILSELFTWNGLDAMNRLRQQLGIGE
jgi:hypothetical protein